MRDFRGRGTPRSVVMHVVCNHILLANGALSRLFQPRLNALHMELMQTARQHSDLFVVLKIAHAHDTRSTDGG